MDFLWWISGGTAASGMDYEPSGPWVTIALSVLVVVGYAAVAFNWYFQSRVTRVAEAKRALARLRGIVICSVFCGLVFVLWDMGWPVGRLYDLGLLVLACHTWWFALRMRGLGLVEERLSKVAELERSAQKYREIAECLPHVVWTATADGRVDFSNRRWREYAGPGERTWLDAVHPDERQEVHAWWARAVAAHEPVSREVRLSTASDDGAATYHTFMVRATPVVEGGTIKWFGACADIEDQKQAEAERESQAKRKAFLFNALSHDLRAPLNNVVLNAQLLKMSVPDDPSLHDSADTVVENAMAAGDLVTKLLEYARTGSQDENVALSRVSIDAMLHQVERRFLPVAVAKGLYLRVLGSGAGPAEITTDRVKLERIVSNLADNAIKFTESGGITIELTARRDEVSIRISDTGVGVPEQDAPHLFDEFYQAANSDRSGTKGFGIGLAICRSLARQLGGDVVLASTGPQGTSFEVTVRDAAATDRGRQPAVTGGETDEAGPQVQQGLCGV